MLRTEHSGIFKNGSFFPFLDENTRGFFPDIYCENLVELLEVNLTKLSGTPCDWVLLEFFTPRVVYIEPPKIPPMQVRFSYACSGFRADSTHEFLLK